MRRFFADHAVVITGASDGIGAELARQFAAQGAWLALGARRAHELDVVAQECISLGGRAIVVPTDVGDATQCEHLIARTREAYGKVDVLINNAGVSAHFPFASARDMNVFSHVVRVNYLGAVYCTHFALDDLKKTKGRIVAISSLAGKTGVPHRTAYAASKHALHGFFDSLRIELAPDGVSVTIVCPGFVSTDLGVHSLGPDDQPADGTRPRGDGVMSAEECARRTVEAIAARRRELVMRPRWLLGALVKLIAPAYIDRVAARAIERRG